MILDILKGFLVGICASAPIGPIAIFVIQKSLSEGHKAGFITGLGATLVDTLFAIIAIFALAFVESFMDTHQTLILLVGGAIVLLLGLSMTFSDPFRKMQESDASPYSVRDFLKAVAMGITNPGAILVIFALFAFFGIELQPNQFQVMPVILAVAAGSASYWFSFSWLLSHLSRKFQLSTMIWINRICGIFVMIIGIVLMAQGLLKIIFL
ncbi:MAG: LysE family transporter [Bacteroidales bacterium]|nr:LysE family transporter [Bacteroidales bacterium]